MRDSDSVLLSTLESVETTVAMLNNERASVYSTDDNIRADYIGILERINKALRPFRNFDAVIRRDDDDR